MEVIDAKLVDLELRSPESPQLLQEILELKTERNAHAPISNLPNEVLLEIFMAMMACFSFQDWHTVAHVCHRWRNVAVGAPMLWINPPMGHHHLTTLMLERSKEANLTIYLDANTSTQTAQAVFNCIRRIESLELNDWYSEGEFPYEFFLQQTPLPASTQEASCLKSLRVVGKCGDSWNSQPMMQFLRPMVSQLHKLLLANVYFEWDVLPLNNLTHLSLQDVTSITSTPIQQLIDTLRQMPLLEELELPFSDDILLLPTVTLPATTQTKLTLPFLRLLKLKDSHPAHLVHFFAIAHTTFPRLRGLVIGVVHLHGDSNFNNHYSSVIQVAASLVNGGDFGTFEWAILRPCSFTMCMLHGKGNSTFIELDIDIPVTSLEAEPCTGAQIMLDLSEMCHPNFSRLLHLHMYSVPTEALQQYRRLFGGPCISYLQQITINNSEILSTLTSILAVPLPDDPSELVDVPFSNMKSISCNRVHFTDSSVLDAFIDCLMLRREHAYPIYDLTLHHCLYVTSNQLTRLKEAVIDLTFTAFSRLKSSGENSRHD